MENGKIRHENHIIDTRAIQFLQNFFPVEWVSRQITPDYGIDLDLELFDYEGENCITLGEHVFLQVKGTTHANYSRCHLFGNHQDEEAFGSPDEQIDVINYKIEVSLLNLVERMGSSLPVLLIVVDLSENKAYYICLNDYIRHVLPFQQPDYKSQGHVTIHIPTENVLSENDLRWYGKRAKVCSLMLEILACCDDCQYLSGNKLIEKVRLLVNRIQFNDGWSGRFCWGFMDVMYQRMRELITNNMFDSVGESYVKLAAKNSDTWQSMMLYVGVAERPELGLTVAQEYSCRKFLDLCSAMLNNLEHDARQWGLPTFYWWDISHS